MKKLTWLLIPLFAYMLTSCAAEEDIANPNTVTDVVTTGKWKVNVFITGSQDQTNDFMGYSLSFQKNGTVTATVGGVNYTGAWTEDVVSRKVNLNFSNPTTALEKINNQWGVADIKAGLISLSNNDTGGEFLGIVQQ